MGRGRALFDRVLPAGPGRTHVLVAAGLALCLLQFVPANLAQFTFDDYKLIVENPTIRGFDGIGAVLASGRPMRGLTFMLDYALFGLDARGYHLVNVAWHYLANLLLYFLLFRLFGARTAAFAAFVFAFHPIHVEAVMGIAHRKEMLAATFLLLSFHAFLYRERWPRAAMAFSLLFFVLGLLSKQVVAVLPLLLVGWEWLRRGPDDRAKLWRLWPWLFLPAGLLIGGALVSLPILADFNFFGYFSPRELTGTTWSRVLATTFSQVPLYLRGLLFPVHLTVLPPIDTHTFADPGPWIGLALFLGVAAAAVATRRDRAVSFGLLWVFVNLLPVMNWVPANSVYADRYLYIPSIGFCLALAGVWRRLETRTEELFSPRAAAMVGGALLFTILVMASIESLVSRKADFWIFPEQWHMEPAVGVFWAGLIMALVVALAMDRLQGPRLGPALERRPALEFALTFILFGILIFGTLVVAEGLVKRRFGFPELLTVAKFAAIHEWLNTHARLGPRAGGSALLPSGTSFSEIANIVVYMVGADSFILFVLFRLERRAARVGPTRRLLLRAVFTLFVCYYGALTVRAVDWASEIRLWRTAVMEDPRSPYGYNNLGKAYLDRRNFERAIYNLRRAADLGPDQPEPWRNLAIAYLATRRLDQATKALEQAVKLNPGDLASRLNLANILVVRAESGQLPDGYQRAIPLYLNILAVSPGSAHALNNLAFCYFSIGAYRQALEYANRSIALDPVSAKPRDLRAKIERAMREEKERAAGQPAQPGPESLKEIKK